MVKEILLMFEEELVRADAKHYPMKGLIEGLHTLKCEIAELEREVMREERNNGELLCEATQCGAMVIKLIRDCILKKEKGEENVS